MKEQSKLKTEAGLWLSLTKNHYNNLLIDHIGGFEFFLLFFILTLSCLPKRKLQNWSSICNAAFRPIG